MFFKGWSCKGHKIASHFFNPNDWYFQEPNNWYLHMWKKGWWKPCFGSWKVRCQTWPGLPPSRPRLWSLWRAAARWDTPSRRTWRSTRSASCLGAQKQDVLFLLGFRHKYQNVSTVKKNQGCGSGSGLDPDSIGSVDPDPDSGSGSGSRRAKMTHKSRKFF